MIAHAALHSESRVGTGGENFRAKLEHVFTVSGRLANDSYVIGLAGDKISCYVSPGCSVMGRWLNSKSPCLFPSLPIGAGRIDFTSQV